MVLVWGSKFWSFLVRFQCLVFPVGCFSPSTEQVPVNALVKGFRQQISDHSFWEKANSKALKLLVEGEKILDAKQVAFDTASKTIKWNEEQKQVVRKTVNELIQKDQGLPLFQSSFGKLTRFFTGSYSPLEDIEFELLVKPGRTNATNVTLGPCPDLTRPRLGRTGRTWSSFQIREERKKEIAIAPMFRRYCTVT